MDGGEREGGSHMYTCMYEGMHMLGEIDKGGEREMRIKRKEEGGGGSERSRERERKKMQSHTDTNTQHTVRINARTCKVYMYNVMNALSS